MVPEASDFGSNIAYRPQNESTGKRCVELLRNPQGIGREPLKDLPLKERASSASPGDGGQAPLPSQVVPRHQKRRKLGPRRRPLTISARMRYSIEDAAHVQHATLRCDDLGPGRRPCRATISAGGRTIADALNRPRARGRRPGRSGACASSCRACHRFLGRGAPRGAPADHRAGPTPSHPGPVGVHDGRRSDLCRSLASSDTWLRSVPEVVHHQPLRLANDDRRMGVRREH